VMPNPTSSSTSLSSKSTCAHAVTTTPSLLWSRVTQLLHKTFIYKKIQTYYTLQRKTFILFSAQLTLNPLINLLPLPTGKLILYIYLWSWALLKKLPIVQLLKNLSAY
jgi:hypothetical protein